VVLSVPVVPNAERVISTSEFGLNPTHVSDFYKNHEAGWRFGLRLLEPQHMRTRVISVLRNLTTELFSVLAQSGEHMRLDP